jgi:hypothetical protein
MAHQELSGHLVAGRLVLRYYTAASCRELGAVVCSILLAYAAITARFGTLTDPWMSTLGHLLRSHGSGASLYLEF